MKEYMGRYFYLAIGVVLIVAAGVAFSMRKSNIASTIGSKKNLQGVAAENVVIPTSVPYKPAETTNTKLDSDATAEEKSLKALLQDETTVDSGFDVTLGDLSE